MTPTDPRSACAFDSLEALCAGFREHHLAGGNRWVSEGCGYGERRSSRGSLAEATVIGVRVGYQVAEDDAWVERPLLGSTVREPASVEDPSTALMLAVRIATSWFPLRLFADADAASGSPPRFVWTLDDSGERLTWTITEGDASAHAPHDDEQVERVVVVDEGGVPMIAASATLARRHAETTRPHDTGDRMAVCGFVPVVRAIAPPTLPTDPESVAARERAREVLRHGTWNEVAGSRAAVDSRAPAATLELFEVGASGCGGGGCSYDVRFRTIEGSMPERGVRYFASEREPDVGCHPDALPEAGESVFVEVAPLAPGRAVSCGFAGYDGLSDRTWAIVRVFVRAPEALTTCGGAPTSPRRCRPR